MLFSHSLHSSSISRYRVHRVGPPSTVRRSSEDSPPLTLVEFFHPPGQVSGLKINSSRSFFLLFFRQSTRCQDIRDRIEETLDITIGPPLDTPDTAIFLLNLRDVSRCSPNGLRYVLVLGEKTWTQLFVSHEVVDRTGWYRPFFYETSASNDLS